MGREREGFFSEVLTTNQIAEMSLPLIQADIQEGQRPLVGNLPENVYCEDCDEKIPEGRVEFFLTKESCLPRRCVECQTKKEQVVALCRRHERTKRFTG